MDTTARIARFIVLLVFLMGLVVIGVYDPPQVDAAGHVAPPDAKGTESVL